MNEATPSPIIIYEDANQAGEVQLDTDQDTVWLTQRQMANLFGKDVRTVSAHLRHVYAEDELEREATIRDFRIVRQEGSRFLQWTTRVLRDHLTQGWTLNRQRFEADRHAQRVCYP